MKSTVRKLMILLAFICVYIGFYPPHIAKANGTVMALEITSYPSKTTYGSGEELDFHDMVLTAIYTDGTRGVVSDYQVEGYDSSKLGEQIVWVRYQYVAVNLTITVQPARVTDIKVEEISESATTISWKPVDGIMGYEVHLQDEYGNFNYFNFTMTNKISLPHAAEGIKVYKIRARGVANGIASLGEFSEPFAVAKKPGAVTGLQVTAASTSSVSLTWNELPGATGYLVYRAAATSDQYSLVASVTTVGYTDMKLSTATGYRYKICAYIHQDTNTGDFSEVISTSTLPPSPTLKFKAGDTKVRLSWNKISSASSYNIYIGDEISGYTLLATSPGNGNTYIAENLKNDRNYTFYITSVRDFEGKKYESPASEKKEVLLQAGPGTSTLPKYYADQAAFEASSAYQSLEFFRNHVDYSRSIVIPGLISTNINGFTSTKMCPQGITFAEDYLLLTAYDMASEENSVIYIMDKTTGSLLTTLALPVKAHAGGIGYDGSYVWVAVGTKVSAIPFEEITAAVNSGKDSVNVAFVATCELGITASYLTYYNDLLWVGSYDELKTTKLHSYNISDEDGELSLDQADTIIMPTRVQGIAFTEDGYLILSRSCQLYQGLRGYIRQLDIYQPDLTVTTEEGDIPLGELIRTVEMPSMNEEIAIDGDYLYVNFESAAFANASFIMDRVCAFSLSSILGLEEIGK
jgi:hypothetical protein